MASRMRFKRWPLVVSGVVLATLAVETLSRPQPEEAAPYHERVRQAEKEVPRSFGPWRGEDVPPTQAAVRLLKPNVIYERRFRNNETGEWVSVMVVQCKDARDISGHYPPVCYPAHGMIQRSVEPRDWQVGGIEIKGREYQFAGERFGRGRLIVDNFIIVPDGRTVRTMNAVQELTGNYLRRFYGAAQVQVIFGDRSIAPQRRRAIFREMIEAHMPLIQTIRTGAPK